MTVLGRSIAEEQCAELEKEKTMMSLELKKMAARHKSELDEKTNTILQVSCFSFFLNVSCDSKTLFIPFCRLLLLDVFGFPLSFNIMLAVAIAKLL